MKKCGCNERLVIVKRVVRNGVTIKLSNGKALAFCVPTKGR